MTQKESDRTLVQVHLVKNIDDVYCRYPGQSSTQPTYVEFDQSTGDLRATYNPEIGNAVPADVWSGQVLRFGIPPLKIKTANALLQRIAPVAQRVLDGVIDASTLVGEWEPTYTKDAEAAIGEIEALCAPTYGWDESERLQVWDAEDMYNGDPPDIDPDSTDGQLESLAEELDSDAMANSGANVIEDTYGYLWHLREAAGLERAREEAALGREE